MRLSYWNGSGSPNFSSRGAAVVSMLVLHYTGMQSAAEALNRLCDTQAQVSAHYVVDEDGTVYGLVQESDCAWHAGVSYWRGHPNVNNISIGIEIVNPGHEWGYRAFPQKQMDAVALLCQNIIARHPIAARDVVGHSDVAPDRKTDPGELFNWQWLAEKGIGLWPEISNVTRPVSDAPALQMKLREYGYLTPQTGLFDEATQKVVMAFQRHFRPSHISGQWDAECEALLAGLLSMLYHSGARWPDGC